MARYVDVYDLNNNFRGELCNHIDCDNCTFHRGAYFCRLGDDLLKYETADVAPVIHAHWNFHYYDSGYKASMTCTACGGSMDSDAMDISHYVYCPCCGARMDEEVK